MQFAWLDASCHYHIMNFISGFGQCIKLFIHEPENLETDASMLPIRLCFFRNRKLYIVKPVPRNHDQRLCTWGAMRGMQCYEETGNYY
jgi:hypothetical protein